MKLKLPFNLAWLVIILGIWLATRQVMSVISLYKSGNKLTRAEMEIGTLNAQKNDLTKKLAEVDSADFAERQLRDKLGYGKPGESILIIPTQNENSNSQIPNPKTETPNWQKWVNLWLGWGSNPQP